MTPQLALFLEEIRHSIKVTTEELENWSGREGGAPCHVS